MLRRMSRASFLLASVLAVTAACSKADSKSAEPQPTGAAVAPRGAAEGAKVEGAKPAAMPPEAYAPADTGGGLDTSFAIEHAAVTGAPGGEQVARVVVKPGKGYKMNKEFPTKLTLMLPVGVSSPKEILLPADAEAFTEQQLAFAVKLTAADKGDFKIPAVLKFAVCTDSTCDPKKQTIELALKAQ